MSLISILSSDEIESFDRPPLIDDELREELFNPTVFVSHSFPRKDLHAIYLLLNGYLKITGRFVHPSKFRIEDMKFISDKFHIDIDHKYQNFPASTLKKYRLEILSSNGYVEFDFRNASFKNEVNRLIRTSLKPKEILHRLTDYLKSVSMIIPSYFNLSKEITNSINHFETEIRMRLDRMLSKDQKEELDFILHSGKNPDKEISPTNPYFLTTIKEPEQSLAPRKIQESIKDFDQIYQLYKSFSDQLDRLELSDSLINYYAKWLMKSRHVSFLALSEPSKKYLYLLAFIAYQFRIRQDFFVDTIIKCTNEFQNDVERQIAKDFLGNGPIKLDHAKKIVQLVKSFRDQVNSMRNVIFSRSIPDNRKVSEVQRLFGEIDSDNSNKPEEWMNNLQNEAEALERSFSKDFKEKLIIDRNVMEHRKLMNRVGGVLKVLHFNAETSDLSIYDAIVFFKNRNRHPNKEWPTNFFSKNKLKLLSKVDEDSYSRLYEVLFSIEIAEQISSGSLNLVNSERYRSMDEYLMPIEEWNKSRGDLIRNSQLGIEPNYADFILRIEEELDQSYAKTNEDLINNPHLSVNSNGKFTVKTPKSVINPSGEGLLSLLERDELIPLIKVLSAVNQASDFVSSFTHFKQKGVNTKSPTNEMFFAAIIALGCNIGVRRMSKVSSGIRFDKLSNLINWYFTKENVDRASSQINSVIENLSIAEIFRKNENQHHTSSDGQKFNVIVPSLLASYSYKYHGTGKGVAAYSFIDEFSRLYYNLVIDSKDREATYVLDGLLGGDVQSDKHSTDTHGYTEIVFGLTSGLGISFSPRIKNLKDQHIYTFRSESKKLYQDKSYQILPSARTYINEKGIESEWDKILRLIVSLKQNISTPSQVVKRLGSYSKKNKLHQALKELGRIFKSIFILKYLNDVDMRQDTERALNRVEQSHQFAKAIFFGGNQELKYATKEEQELVLSCRHLIQNSIVLFNYLELTKILIKRKPDDKIYEETLDLVKNGSVMTWRHINIHGEYDFENPELDDKYEMGDILNFKI